MKKYVSEKEGFGIFLILISILGLFALFIFHGFEIQELYKWLGSSVAGFIIVLLLKKIKKNNIRKIVWLLIFFPFVILTAIFQVDIFMIDSGLIFGIAIGGFLVDKKMRKN